MGGKILAFLFNDLQLFVKVGHLTTFGMRTLLVRQQTSQNPEKIG